MGHVGHGADVGDVARRVADGLAEDRLGALVDEGRHAVDVVGGGEADLDAQLRQGVGEEVVGAAVEGGGGDDVVAALADGEQRVGHRRHTRGQGQTADATLQGRQALLQHIAGGVHDAGVDIARHFEIEEVRPVLGVIEGIGGGLVNRRGDGLGGRVRLEAGVDGQGLDLHGVSWWVGAGRSSCSVASDPSGFSGVRVLSGVCVRSTVPGWQLAGGSAAAILATAKGTVDGKATRNGIPPQASGRRAASSYR